MRIKYCAPVYDPSGYGEFSRTFIYALHRAGAEVEVQPVSFDRARPKLGELGALCKRLERRLGGHDFKIINATPQHFARLREPGCINIGFTMFETTRIPDVWVHDCNLMDAVLVPCAWNRDVFEQSGVTVPVRVAAPGLDIDEFRPGADNLPAADRHADPFGWAARATWIADEPHNLAWLRRAYKFYSVFQWTERKNPFGLLKAYFAEFHGDDDVCLVLKTYRSSVSRLQQAIIRYQIADLKRRMTLKRFPPLLLVGGLLSREQLRQMHHDCDCFVLPHRAEGFGMPHLEAMACAKPVIATGFSGNMEFMTEQNSRLLPYQLTPVCRMQWIKWYEGDMMWAEPDLGALRASMRELYAGRDLGRDLGLKAQADVFENFNWTVRASAMLRSLEELKTPGLARRAS